MIWIKKFKVRHCMRIYLKVCMYACMHVRMHVCMLEHFMEISSQLHMQYWGQNVFETPFANKGELSCSTLEDSGILCSLGLAGEENEWVLPMHDSWQPFPPAPRESCSRCTTECSLVWEAPTVNPQELFLRLKNDEIKKKKKEGMCSWGQIWKWALINFLREKMRKWEAPARALGKGEWLKASQLTQPWGCEIPPAFWLSPQAMCSEKWDSENEAVMFLAFFMEAASSKDLQVYWSRRVTLAAWVLTK